jgi:8-oxo-dGTP pyrophosphatase MutT (NUDIX family)
MTCVDVLGLTADGRVAFVSELGQGDDPRVLAFEQGYVAVRPLDALRNDHGVIQLRFAVRPREGEARPGQPSRGADAGLDADALGEIEVRQRVAAYALVTSSKGLLATEFSDRTSVPGRWGMPGGGIEDHEEPAEAVLREVAEETEQDITLGDLVEVQSSHWVGRSPRDTVEDFHAVRLIYEASCDAPTTPVVVDVGGTTESARWVPLDAWRAVAWTAGWHQILAARLP